ncbi:MAG: hypothetical protein ACI4KA_11650 [Oscillospiraceae bacterium]
MAERYTIDIGTASTADRPLFVLDEALTCIFSADASLLETGQSLLPALRRKLALPLGGASEELLYLNGHFCFAVITPVQGENSAQLYICEITDKKRAEKIYQCTDAGAEMLSVYDSMEYCLADAWRCHSGISSAAGGELAEYLHSLEADLYRLSAAIKNTGEYVRALHSVNRNTLFDIGRLCEQLSRRCNAVLAKCGRSFEYVCEAEEMYVNVSSRRAVVSLVNAIQNALLYSPRDTVPVLAAYKESGFINIRIENDSIMYSPEDFARHTDIEFCGQRTGCGLPVIRAFADAAGGSCDISYKDGRAVLLLRIPEAVMDDNSHYCLENSFFSSYVTGVPDYLEVRMREVVELFGDEEKTEKIQ